MSALCGNGQIRSQFGSYICVWACYGTCSSSEHSFVILDVQISLSGDFSDVFSICSSSSTTFRAVLPRTCTFSHELARFLKMLIQTVIFRFSCNLCSPLLLWTNQFLASWQQKTSFQIFTETIVAFKIPFFPLITLIRLSTSRGLRFP